MGCMWHGGQVAWGAGGMGCAGDGSAHACAETPLCRHTVTPSHRHITVTIRPLFPVSGVGTKHKEARGGQEHVRKAYGARRVGVVSFSMFAEAALEADLFQVGGDVILLWW